MGNQQGGWEVLEKCCGQWPSMEPVKVKNRRKIQFTCKVCGHLAVETKEFNKGVKRG